MDEEYFMKQVHALNGLKKKAARKQETFFQRILIASSGLLGIVVSLHTTSSPLLCIRLVFLLALVSLALGVMATAVVVYDLAQLHDRASQAFHSEVQTALRSDRKVEPVYARLKKRTKFCQKSSLLFLSAGLLLLTLYSALSAWF